MGLWKCHIPAIPYQIMEVLQKISQATSFFLKLVFPSSMNNSKLKHLRQMTASLHLNATSEDEPSISGNWFCYQNTLTIKKFFLTCHQNLRSSKFFFLWSTLWIRTRKNRSLFSSVWHLFWYLNSAMFLHLFLRLKIIFHNYHHQE